MFNPNFSLFVPMPEGGATFQPNPNSTVQNDPTRGTDHLDFFRFVGRVVGKALYDGMLVDAYFTRSFYKHCLGQPLTYQARPGPKSQCCRSRLGSGLFPGRLAGRTLHNSMLMGACFMCH